VWFKVKSIFCNLIMVKDGLRKGEKGAKEAPRSKVRSFLENNQRLFSRDVDAKAKAGSGKSG